MRKLNLFLFLVSVLCFGFGNSFTAWFVFVPVFFLVNRLDFPGLPAWGFAYGFCSYFLFLLWMLNFSIVALFGACLLYGLYWLLIFALLKIILAKAKSFAFILFPVVITLFEYVRTLGFLGFSYGINGYSQAGNLLMIQTADLFGVWGISFLLNLSSAVVFCLVTDWKTSAFGKKVLPLTVFCGLIAFSAVYGSVKISLQKNIENKSEMISVVAVQNNADPWKGGIENYERAVTDLKELTDSALALHPDAALIVWPETAVIPSILKHFSGPDSRRKKLVEDLLSYINGKNSAFVIGNFNSLEGKDYNSVFVFLPGKNVVPPEPMHYEKMHLVPFCEYFPYKKQFPLFYQKLLGGDTHMWEPGVHPQVFEIGGLKFSTPVCFEDTFDYDCRRFVGNGANAFVTLANDEWAKSRRCQVQHLQAAVFRCVENRVPAVRSSSSGETCIINTYGKITARSAPFEKNYVYGKMVKLAMGKKIL